MRIDLHIGSREVTESSRSGASSGTAKKKAAAGTPAQAHSDEAKLSFSSARVRELEQLAANVPDIRKDRVQSLKTALQESRYEPQAEQVPSAMLADGLARADLLRR
jgi:flagellar biosynthesis anti-sigma factor FlgM